MRVALLHDYLNQYGGAERVLETFCEIFPDAPIYTLFYDKEKTFGKFEGKDIRTSFLNSKVVTNNHRFFIPLMPLAASSMSVGKEYNVVLSSSAGYGKGIKCSHARHINYCHTPLRYAWEQKKYFDWHLSLQLVAMPIFEYLKKWDYRAGQRPDILLANSNYIAGKIKEYYKRNADVLYPPVDLENFYYNSRVKEGNYFLAAGRMIHYKKFDLIIEAFKKLDLPLVIVGEGPEQKKLKEMARGFKIHFLPFCANGELRHLYNTARAFIFPQVEDFGLVAAEAQACGTPVIAFNEGGAKEIVEDGKTGILFNHQTADELALAVKRFLPMKFDREYISKFAKRFDKENFKNRILEIVNDS